MEYFNHDTVGALDLRCGVAPIPTLLVCFRRRGILTEFIPSSDMLLTRTYTASPKALDRFSKPKENTHFSLTQFAPAN